MIKFLSPALRCFPQVVGIFSKFLPSLFTYHSYPDSCSLASGTILFGPIEYQQIVNGCVLCLCAFKTLRCSSLHKTGPYTVSFFGEKALQKEEENSSALCYQKI